MSRVRLTYSTFTLNRFKHVRISIPVGNMPDRAAAVVPLGGDIRERRRNVQMHSCHMYACWRTLAMLIFAFSTTDLVSLSLLPKLVEWLWSQADLPRPRRRTSALESSQWKSPKAAGGPCGRLWSSLAWLTVWKLSLVTMMFYACQQGSGFYVILFYSVNALCDCRVHYNDITVIVFLFVFHVVGSALLLCLHNVFSTA